MIYPHATGSAKELVKVKNSFVKMKQNAPRYGEYETLKEARRAHQLTSIKDVC